MKSIGLVLIMILLTGTCLAFAEDNKPVQTPPPPSKYDQYWKQLSEKFDFGTTNFLIGWTTILSEPADHYDKTMPRTKRTTRLLAGLGQGFVNFGLNTTGGFLNIVTAPIPQFRIPLPKNGVDVKRVAG